MKGFLSNPLFKFTLIASSLYLSWYCLYEFFLKYKTNFDNIIIDNLVYLSQKFLTIFGFDFVKPHETVYEDVVQISGSLNGVTVGAPCDGIVLLALFTVFIIAFPGPWKHKLWFLPAGLAAIHIINAFRITFLAIIAHKKIEWLQFNHDYTFTILVYAFVFALWMIWVNRFSKFTKKQNAK